MPDPPPSKRQRRLVVLSSSEDEEDSHVHTSISGSNSKTNDVEDKDSRSTTAQPLTLRSNRARSPTALQPPAAGKQRRRQRQQRSRTVSTNTTPASSPEKSRVKYRSKPTDKGQSLHSFFQPASAEQRWSTRKVETKNNEVTVREIDLIKEDEKEEEEDAIEDDSCDEIFSQLAYKDSRPSSTSSFPTHHLDPGHGQRTTGTANESRSSKTVKSRPIRSGKRFLLPDSAAPEKAEKESQSTGSFRPWAEEYAPANLDELAVHKGKVADVKKWLVDVFSRKTKRVGAVFSSQFLFHLFIFHKYIYCVIHCAD